MAIDAFLKVPDIPGEGTRDGHQHEIEIHGMTFGMQVPEVHSSRPRAGRPRFDAVVFTKHYDRSSPSLKLALVQNTTFAEVVCTVRRTVEGETRDYLAVRLVGAWVTSYDMYPAPDQEGRLEERVAFTSRSLTFRYDGQHEVELDVHVTR